MRARPDAASADTAGQGLPDTVRAYVAGAVAFARWMAGPRHALGPALRHPALAAALMVTLLLLLRLTPWLARRRRA